MPLGARTRRLLLFGGYLAAALTRIGLASRPPAETTDVLRNLVYGRAFWRYGFAVYDLEPGQVAPHAELGWLWAGHTYDYPVLTLFFFAALARATSSLVAARLVLSAIELLNARLVADLLRAPWAGLVWFAGPASLWWVSGEGQFEPLAVTFLLLALRALGAGRGELAWAWLAAAVQVKLLPVLLVPALLAAPAARSLRAAIVFLASFAPSLAAMATSSYLARLLVPGYWPRGFNPFAWNPTARSLLGWVPAGIAWANAALTAVLLVAALAGLVGALRRRDARGALGWLPLLGFLVLLKSLAWAQFWYLLLAPALALAAPPGRRTLAVVLLALLEARAASALVLGPVGMPQWFPIERYLDGGW